jgi:hypothetical protein
MILSKIKKVITSKLYCCLIASVILLCSADNSGCKIINKSYKSGESITYKIYYHAGLMNIGAGECTFSNKLEQYNGKPVYHVVGEGKTYKSYDWFYKVRDKYESFIDTTTNLPVKFTRNVNEGGYKFSELALFNHTMGNVTGTKGTFKISSCCQDVLSTIYWSRNIDYSKHKLEDKIPFKMYIDNQEFEIYVRYLGKEKISTELGTFNCVKFKPLLIEGTLFKGGEGMVVWATDDWNHIPVRVESPIVVGEIRADLIAAKGLRHGLSSWIKKYYN